MRSLSGRAFTACIVLFALCVLPFSPSLAADYRFTDAGMERAFDMALDEVAISKGDQRRVLTPIAPVADRAALRVEASRRQRDLAERIEPVLYETVNGQRRGVPRIVTSELYVRTASQTALDAIRDRKDVADVKPTDAANDMWIVVAVSPFAALDLAVELAARDDIDEAQPLLARQQTKKWVPNDTLFNNQWHLRNTGQFNGTAGNDVKVTNVWNTYRGSNVWIGIVDDGLQTAHPDLSPNVDNSLGWDFNYNDDNPNPGSGDDHGTACAGVAAARGNNSIGVSGAAPFARLVGLRLISLATSDADEADAMNWENQAIHIKSNSWGPSDNGSTLEAPGPLTAAALSNACWIGRSGRGVLIFWAGGNGKQANDNSNFDGYANSIYTIAVAALANTGIQSWYSEPGANLVVTAPSSGDNTVNADIGITTTDRTGSTGYSNGDYTDDFGGTSSACPLAAGVGALMLDANPLLGWRDVQEILIRSATRNHVADSDWRQNGAGFWFNHKYGAGLVNADGAVNLATTWTNLGPQTVIMTNQTGLSIAIPDNNAAGVTRTFTVTQSMRVEHAVLSLSATHPYRGDLLVELISPANTTSVLTTVRGDSGNNYSNWRFMSVRHWGESALGTWTLRVADRASGDVGTLTAAGLTLYGSSGEILTNQPPILIPVGNRSVVESNTLSFSVTAFDPADGDPISLSATSLPGGATFGATNGLGHFNWVSASPTGTYNVTFHAWDKDGTNTETIAISVTSEPVVDTNCAVIISEYVEGSSNNKALEIYNPGPNAVDLSAGQYIVQIYFNGSASVGNTISLAGTIPAGGTHVLVHSSAGASLLAYADQTSGSLTYNGDDAVVLRSGGASGPILDVIGQVGFDPGTEWGSGLASTADNTLRRKAAVLRGDTSPSDAFDPSVEWDGFAVDTFDGLGAHVSDCGGSPSTPPVLNPIGNKTVTVSNTLQFVVTAIETDGNPVTMTASNMPPGAVFNTSGTSGTFIWSNAAPIGVYTSSFYAADVDGVVSETIHITVTEPSTGCVSVVSFTNSAPITIVDYSEASPYPATISVSGITSTVEKVTVTLHQLSHSYAYDLDILVVAPGGQAVALVSGVATNGSGASGVTWTFDREAASTLPLNGPLSSGTYLPSDMFGFAELPAPAPEPPYTDGLEDFEGVSPNGSWSLYIMDWLEGDSGSVAGGWSLSFTVACDDGPTPPPTNGVCGVIISEYVEGSGDNKAIELFNGTGSAIDLAAEDYTLSFYFNGGTSPGNTIALTGVLPAGGTYVLAHGNAASAILAVAAQSNSGSWFNGNDPVVLRSGTTVIDSIGQVGDSGVFGENVTLSRKSSVLVGDPVIDDVFDRTVEWNVFPQNTFSGLGSHSMDCPSGPVDSDGDGIDDQWELDTFGDLTTADATSDWDNDGFIDLHEFLAGTDPKDDTSYLHVDDLDPAAGGDIVIRWPGVSGKSYGLFRTTDLVEGLFVPVATNIPGLEPFNTYTDSIPPNVGAVYRIQLEY